MVSGMWRNYMRKTYVHATVKHGGSKVLVWSCVAANSKVGNSRLLMNDSQKLRRHIAQ
jgi:hypothetical protein